MFYKKLKNIVLNYTLFKKVQETSWCKDLREVLSNDKKKGTLKFRSVSAKAFKLPLCVTFHKIKSLMSKVQYSNALLWDNAFNKACLNR